MIYDLVFRNTATRKDAAYVIRLLEDGQAIHYWGRWPTYVQRGVDALQSKRQKYNWRTQFYCVNDEVHRRLDRAYRFQEQRSRLPRGVSALNGYSPLVDDHANNVSRAPIKLPEPQDLPEPAKYVTRSGSIEL